MKFADMTASMHLSDALNKIQEAMQKNRRLVELRELFWVNEGLLKTDLYLEVIEELQNQGYQVYFHNDLNITGDLATVIRW